MALTQERRILCSNRRARYEYQIEEVIEAGIALTGTEVKSLRDGKADTFGADIPISQGAGTYTITFDDQTSTYEVKKN